MFKIIHKVVGKPAEVLEYNDASEFSFAEIHKYVKNAELILLPVYNRMYAAYVNEDSEEDTSLPINLVWPNKYYPQFIRDDMLIVSGWVSDKGEEVSLTDAEIEDALKFCSKTEASDPKNKELIEAVRNLDVEE